MLKLPKKISPDRIKNATIEVNYASKYPYEVLIGMIFNALDNTYHYANRPSNGQQLLPVPIAPVVLFYTDLVQVQLKPNSIVFNIIDKYIYWENYKPEIERTLRQIFESGVIDSYYRVGVRYISEYKNQDLGSLLNVSFALKPFPEWQSSNSSYSFNTEFKSDTFAVILNLNNNVLGITLEEIKSGKQPSPISNIDIDIVRQDININDLTQLMQIVEDAHNKEKIVFFSLLNDDFLRTLNPEY
jgi:uncharacterized protein (TIGR04255 family)